MITSNTNLRNPISPHSSVVTSGADVEVACLETLHRFIAPGQVTQLMAFDVVTNGRRDARCVAGYFEYEKLNLMAKEAARLSGNARGVHFTLNPLNPDVLTRSPNRVQRVGDQQAACDRDILGRKWLMIDIDPCRDGGTSATDQEKQQAATTMQNVSDFLRSSGFSAPILGDSGNGYHLYFRVDLPASDKVPHRILKALSAQYGSEIVKIDTSVASAAQLTRLYGTLTAKGDSTSDRPHRFSKILQVPEEITSNDVMVLCRVVPAISSEPAKEPSPVPTQLLSRARSYLAAMPPSISGQSGHNRLFEAACRLVQGFDLSQSESLPLLREYNRRAEPPWEEPDLLHKLEDADAQQTSRPRGYLVSACDPRASKEAIIQPNDDFLPILAGPVFPTPIPDFVPAPCESSLRLLQIETDIERPPGRPKLDCANYLYWQLLNALYEQKVSPVVIPDAVLAAGIGGASPPADWRRRLVANGRRRYSVKAARRIDGQIGEQLIRVIDELQMAIAVDPSGDHTILSEKAEQLTKRKLDISLQVAPEDCPSWCPLHGSDFAHDHFQLQPTEAFCQRFKCFVTKDSGRSLEFDFGAKQEDNSTILQSLIAANELHWAYLPIQIFGQACRLNSRKIRMIQGIMRETTRTKNTYKHMSRPAKPELIQASTVRGLRGKATISCPFLDPHLKYVAFGGNLREHRGRGYQLIGKLESDQGLQGGWLRRFGYPAVRELGEDRIWEWAAIMLADLVELSPHFGLVVGAVDRIGKWRSLDELPVMVGTAQGRRWLKTCSLRLFAPEDYLVRWRHWFASRLGFSFIPGGDWSQPQDTKSATAPRPSPELLKSRLSQMGITGKQLAERLGWSESKVSRQLSGRTKLSDTLLGTVDELSAQALTIAPKPIESL